MDDKFKNIIAKIAKKHGVIIDKDDPALMLLTIYEYMVEQSESLQLKKQKGVDEHHEAALSRFEQTMTDKFEKWNSVANNKATNAINVGLEQTQAQINTEKSLFFEELKSLLDQQLSLNKTLTKKIIIAAIFCGFVCITLCVTAVIILF